MQINSVTTGSPTPPPVQLPQAQTADPSVQSAAQTQTQNGGAVKGHHHRGGGHHHHKDGSSEAKPASGPQDQVSISDAAKQLNQQMTEQGEPET
jgi:hypothetical protein